MYVVVAYIYYSRKYNKSCRSLTLTGQQKQVYALFNSSAAQFTNID